jgi:hypothetical protein
MSNGDDTQQQCCAIGVCCGGDDDLKRRQAVAQILRDHLGSAPPTLDHVAEAILEAWDLVPKGWGFSTVLTRTAAMARTFPYVG